MNFKMPGRKEGMGYFRREGFPDFAAEIGCHGGMQYISRSGSKIQKKLFYYFFISVVRYNSSAAAIDGACGNGAFTSSLNPASSTAAEVVGPKAPI